MEIKKQAFGTTEEGVRADLYTLTNVNRVKVDITNYGCKIVRLFIPDKNGRLDDIVLGFENIEGYCKPNPFFGTVVGRCANRIEKGRFNLNGIEYQLNTNRGGHHLHGGNKGFDKYVWSVEIESRDGVEYLKLHHFSEDGDEGYPGNLYATVIYCLTDDNELVIRYKAATDKDTLVNLTNHCYFNLSGHSCGDILGHELMINSSEFTDVNSELIPNGKIKNVKGTPFDFTNMTSIGSRISDESLSHCGGYDVNYVLNNNSSKPGKPGKTAEVYDPASGRIMEAYTTMPGMQFYTGNFLNGSVVGKDGCAYRKHAGLCLETQYFPNAINIPHFLSPVLKPGQEYDHTTVYKFSIKEGKAV